MVLPEHQHYRAVAALANKYYPTKVLHVQEDRRGLQYMYNTV